MWGHKLKVKCKVSKMRNSIDRVTIHSNIMLQCQLFSFAGDLIGLGERADWLPEQIEHKMTKLAYKVL